MECLGFKRSSTLLQGYSRENLLRASEGVLKASEVVLIAIDSTIVATTTAALEKKRMAKMLCESDERLEGSWRNGGRKAVVAGEDGEVRCIRHNDGIIRFGDGNA